MKSSGPSWANYKNVYEFTRLVNDRNQYCTRVRVVIIVSQRYINEVTCRNYTIPPYRSACVRASREPSHACSWVDYCAQRRRVHQHTREFVEYWRPDIFCGAFQRRVLLHTHVKPKSIYFRTVRCFTCALCSCVCVAAGLQVHTGSRRIALPAGYAVKQINNRIHSCHDSCQRFIQQRGFQGTSAVLSCVHPPTSTTVGFTFTPYNDVNNTQSAPSLTIDVVQFFWG